MLLHKSCSLYAISHYFDYNSQFPDYRQASFLQVVVCNIDTRTRLYVFYMLRYLTYATFPLTVSFGTRETSEQFSKEAYAIYVYYLHAPRQITGGTDHDPAPVPVMMRERISVQVTRVVTNFLTVVSATRTHYVGVCVWGLAWLCHDSSLQFVQWSKATAGVREHYRRIKPKEKGKERTINRKNGVGGKHSREFAIELKIVIRGLSRNNHV